MNDKDDDSYYNDEQSLFAGEDENDLALQSSQGSAKIAREDIQLMNVVRAIVILTLLTFAVISAETVFIISLISKENAFADAYSDAAFVLSTSMYESFSSKVWIAKTFAHDLAMDAHNGNSVWPNMTFDHFSDRCKGPLYLSESSTVSFSPFVSSEERVSWEEFATLTHPIESASFLPLTSFESNSSSIVSDDTTYQVSNRTVSEGIFRYRDGVAQDEEFSAQGYFPVWQQAFEYSKEHDAATMFNLPSNNLRTFGIRSMMELQGTSISGFLYEDSQGQDYADFATPRSSIYAPIFLSISSDTVQITGVAEFEFQWEHVFADVLTGIDLPLVLVVENTCDHRQFSYEVIGYSATFMGEGDLHDDSVDGYSKAKSSIGDFEKIFLQHAYNDSADANFCGHQVSYFPSSDFKRHFVDNKPDIYRAIVIAVFLFIVFIFYMYDTLIEKRQGKVIDAAAKSDAIVRSLFPSNIRDRLYEQAVGRSTAPTKDTWKNSSQIDVEGGVIETPKYLLKSFMNKSPEDQAVHAEHTSKDVGLSEPIADLFPQTTIMFADISGFTAWSSEREPSQVFTLLETIYQQMDRAAKKLGVFKVETVGDCYVAATGVPDPQPQYGVETMVRFARLCLLRMNVLTKELESQLGPGTAELTLRIGIHSGPVTAGVLRGQKARFQLFGNTMNVASRMESTGQRNKIQLSPDTAEILIKCGHADWLAKRENLVQVKGKGMMQTYWLVLKTSSQSYASTVDGSEAAFSIEAKKKKASKRKSRASAWTGTALEGVLGATEVDEDLERLVNWNVDVMLLLLKRVATARFVKGVERQELKQHNKPEGMVLDDVKVVIDMPEFDAEVATRTYNEDVELSPEVKKELRAYVAAIASGYRKNPFHNFEHASHVILSANKLLKRIMAADDCKPLDNALTCRELHQHTYGIATDPLTQFAVVFSALVHDVGHEGVPNAVLGKMHPLLADKYRNKSIAEQRSVDAAWNLLFLPQFSNLRASIFQTGEELDRFRSLVVNGVMATDIFDKELKQLRDSRWDTAFHIQDQETQAAKQSMDRKATIVIEHIIQASDVAHTMQHFFVYGKWNERLYKEMYFNFLSGRMEKDPTPGWYNGELWFFDNYVIPLAKKLKECAVFGVSSDEYLNYAIQNRTEWEKKGKTMCEAMKKKAEKEAQELGLVKHDRKDEGSIPDAESVEFSLGNSSLDTTLDASRASDFEDLSPEIKIDIQKQVAEDIRRSQITPPALEGLEAGQDSPRSHSTRTVKVPSGKIGIIIDASNQGPVVQEVLQTSPVKGRIYPGDRIVAINGTSVKGLSQENLAILMASQTDREREFAIESM